MRFIAAQRNVYLLRGEDPRLSSRSIARRGVLFVLRGSEQVASSVRAHDGATPEEFARLVLEARMSGNLSKLIDWCYTKREKFYNRARTRGLESMEEIEDAFQTLMTRFARIWATFWKKGRTGDIGEAFRAYLWDSFHNEVYARRKRLRRHHKIFPRGIDVGDEKRKASDDAYERDDAEESYEWEEKRDAVTQAVREALTPKEWDVYQLVVQDGVAPADAAIQLDTTISCIYAHKSNAKRKLGWWMYRWAYHFSASEIEDAAAFLKQVNTGAGFLQRVRDAILEDCVAAIDAVPSTDWAMTDVAMIAEAINIHVLDDPEFCLLEDVALVFGETSTEFEDLATQSSQTRPAPWRYVRINRLVLDYFLRGALRQARKKVLL
jgi:RNA polymerase sigma factor (sigma-70 family)